MSLQFVQYIVWQDISKAITVFLNHILLHTWNSAVRQLLKLYINKQRRNFDTKNEVKLQIVEWISFISKLYHLGHIRNLWYTLTREWMLVCLSVYQCDWHVWRLKQICCQTGKSFQNQKRPVLSDCNQKCVFFFIMLFLWCGNGFITNVVVRRLWLLRPPFCVRRTYCVTIFLLSSAKTKE